MHDQPHLGFINGRVEPIEDRWERMIAGTPWVASCTVAVDSDDVESCSGPEAGDALSYAAFGDHGVREFFTHVRFHKHEDDARIIVHLLVELYARSLEEATEVLESAARGRADHHLAGRGVAPAGSGRRDPPPRLTSPAARAGRCPARPFVPVTARDEPRRSFPAAARRQGDYRQGEPMPGKQHEADGVLSHPGRERRIRTAAEDPERRSPGRSAKNLARLAQLRLGRLSNRVIVGTRPRPLRSIAGSEPAARASQPTTSCPLRPVQLPHAMPPCHCGRVQRRPARDWPDLHPANCRSCLSPAWPRARSSATKLARFGGRGSGPATPSGLRERCRVVWSGEFGAHLDGLDRPGRTRLQRGPNRQHHNAGDNKDRRAEHQDANPSEQVGRRADDRTQSPTHGGRGEPVAPRGDRLYTDQPRRDRDVADHHHPDRHAEREPKPRWPLPGHDGGRKTEHDSDRGAPAKNQPEVRASPGKRRAHPGNPRSDDREPEHRVQRSWQP